jgi:hypothetical protein
MLFLLTPLAFFLPSRSAHIDIAKLALIGLAAAVFFLFTAPYFFPGGADQFTRWADALVHGTALDPHLAQRDVGFPLLIVLSGYTLNGSFIGITIIHAAFGVLIPVLLYLSLYRLSQSVAFFTGLLAIVTLAPFYFVKWMHHDQTYIFFMMLTIALLASYLQTRRYPYLYAFCIAIVAASISRPAGSLLFPLFMLIAYVAVRGKLGHYLACALIFVTVTLGYLWHRYEIFDMAHRPATPSYTGQQIFYNVYMNSAEFGIRLSPALGPNMADITDALYQKLGRDLRSSIWLTQVLFPVPAEFSEQHIYPYTRDEFIKRIYEVPNWEYYSILATAEPVDRKYLLASWEVFRAYPWYFMGYTLRNATVFVLNPGYAHTRYNLNPFGRIGLDFPPMVAGVGAEGTKEISQRAAREVRFQPGVLMPDSIKQFSADIEEGWRNNYHHGVVITAALMALAWIGIAAVLLSWLWPASGLRAVTDLYAGNGFTASVLAASCLFFYNVAMTAAFVEPDYRYHHFIVPLRVLISGFGVAVVVRILLAPKLRLVRRCAASAPCALVAGGFGAIQRHDAFALVFARRPVILGLVTGLTAITMFAWWARFMVMHTG